MSPKSCSQNHPQTCCRLFQAYEDDFWVHTFWNWDWLAGWERSCKKRFELLLENRPVDESQASQTRHSHIDWPCNGTRMQWTRRVEPSWIEPRFLPWGITEVTSMYTSIESDESKCRLASGVEKHSFSRTPIYSVVKPKPLRSGLKTSYYDVKVSGLGFHWESYPITQNPAIRQTNPFPNQSIPKPIHLSTHQSQGDATIHYCLRWLLRPS